MGESYCNVHLDGMKAKKTEHAGFGIFATKSFDPGDVLWEESPMLETAERLELKELQLCANQSPIFRNQIVYMRSFARSSTQMQARLMARCVADRKICERSYLWKHIESASALAAQVLYPEHSEQTLQNICLIFMANQYSSSGSSGVIYEVGSLFNHHCLPNATYTYNDSSGKGKWFALRPIAPGDEICVSYVYPHYPTFWRQDQLMHRYLFDCRCSKCKEVDTNRLIPCSICNPHKRKNVELAKIKAIQHGFFTRSLESGILESWVCDSCGVERLRPGVPILLEKQLCVDVQMMMRHWSAHTLDAITELRDLSLRLLGPKHFCYIYSLQCTCNALVESETKNFDELVSYALTVTDWVEEREPEFSGFHLQRLLVNVVRWCLENEVKLNICSQFIFLVQPWVFLFGTENNVNEILSLKSRVPVDYIQDVFHVSK